MKVTIDKDLRSLFGPARDQDPRPTCMAFAGSDAHAGARPGWEPLSVEWAYYHALQRDGAEPNEGVSLNAMLETLRVDGQPVEAAWPYITSSFVNVAEYHPPSTGNPLYRRDSVKVLPTVERIVEQLDRDQPVLLTMSVSHSFFHVPGNGVIAASEPIESHRIHAVVAVGHGHSSSDHLILVRNSWGEDWALEGHAWLHIAYLEPRLLATASLTREL